MAGAPNILLIMTDQQRWDAVPAAGALPVAAPALAELASAGTRFPRAYCQAPLCVPSRMSFFSGRYPHQTGCEDNETSLWPEAPSFVRSLREAGYHTANVGKLHYTWFHDLEILVSQQLLRRLGFDDPLETTGKMSQGNLRASAYSEHLRAMGLLEDYHHDLIARSAAGPLRAREMSPSVLDPGDHIDGWVMNKAADWLLRVDAEPFFLWVGPPGPHDPFDPPAPYASMYRPEDMPLGPLEYRYPVRSDATSAGIPHATPGQIREMRTQYLGNVSFLSDLTGKLLEVLRQRFLLDRTWVFYCSDHGEMLGDHRLIWKAQFFEPAARVPLIVRPPDGAGFPVGRASDALVELLDVPATIMELAGAELPGQRGRSLLPVLRSGGGADNREIVACEMPGQLMLRDDSAKVVIDAETGKVCRAFDLTADPREENDLAAATAHGEDAALPPAIASLARRAAGWRRDSPRDLPAPWRHDIPYGRWGRNPLREDDSALRGQRTGGRSVS